MPLGMRLRRLRSELRYRLWMPLQDLRSELWLFWAVRTEARKAPRR